MARFVSRELVSEVVAMLQHARQTFDHALKEARKANFGAAHHAADIASQEVASAVDLIAALYGLQEVVNPQSDQATGTITKSGDK